MKVIRRSLFNYTVCARYEFSSSYYYYWCISVRAASVILTDSNRSREI